MNAVGLDPNLLRADAKRLLAVIKSQENRTETEILNSKDNELGQIFENVRKNRFFKYTDAWGVGLGRIMELANIEPKVENFEIWVSMLYYYVCILLCVICTVCYIDVYFA